MLSLWDKNIVYNITRCINEYDSFENNSISTIYLHKNLTVFFVD